MCTASWCHHSPGCYTLFFNRDESRSRLPAIPPRERIANGVPFLTPADGDHGGTWLLANAHGLSIGLLNLYAVGTDHDPTLPTSRGQLVLSLAEFDSPAAVGKFLTALDPTGYRPFELFAVAADKSQQLWVWDGRSLQTRTPRLPLTTSSHRSELVEAYRKETYQQLGPTPTPGQLAEFHLFHNPQRPKSSVRLRRETTQTVSHSRIDVSPQTVTFSYRPEPDESLDFEPTETISIPRASA